ncbi:MAG: hypothetical protein WCX83_05885 [Candidatus Cloacimonas sp.]
MAVKKQTTSADTKKQKAFWILDNEGKVVEVIEQDIIDSPQDFLDKEIWDKPPNQYELVITLKRKR